MTSGVRESVQPIDKPCTSLKGRKVQHRSFSFNVITVNWRKNKRLTKCSLCLCGAIEAREREGRGRGRTTVEVEVWIPTQPVMKMRMWLHATGFVSNWYNECILLPLIECMPRDPSSRSDTSTHTHTHVRLLSQPRWLLLLQTQEFLLFCEGHADSPLEKKEAFKHRSFLLAFFSWWH